MSTAALAAALKPNDRQRALQLTRKDAGVTAMTTYIAEMQLAEAA
ncbi:hypothetical protein [Ramlibacter agri]|nr:hypothetical protein [Ramlibacter agri]